MRRFSTSGIAIMLTILLLSINAKQAHSQSIPIDFTYTPEQPCAYGWVFFTSVVNPAVVATYNWDFGDGNHSSNANDYHAYYEAGNYTVTLTITDVYDSVSSVSKTLTVNPNPITNFSFTTGACAGTPVQFTDLSQINGGGSIIQWYWYFGDPASGASNTSTIQNPEHIYNVAGTYIVGLTITNSNGCSDSLFLNVNIITTPSPITHITGSTAPCQGSSQMYSVTNVSGTTYTWSLPADWAINSGQGTNSILVTTGTQNGNVSVIPSNNCATGALYSIAVTTSMLPAATSAITGNATPCQNSSQTYSVTNVGGITYNWGIPTGWSINSGQGTNSIIVTAGSQSGNITVIPNNNCGSGDTTTKQVVIYAFPSVDFSFTPAQPCALNLVFFTAIVNPAVVATYEWQFGDGSSSTLDNPVHSYSVPGTFTASLTVTDTAGCVISVAKTMAVYANPDANFSFPSVACAGAPVQFTDLSQTSGGGAIAQYYWFFDDPASGSANTSTLQNPQHVYATAGDYLVGLFITNINGCSDSLLSIITVNPVPAQPSAITGNTAPCQGSSQTYSVTNVSGIAYTWTLPAGWTINNGQGTHSITVTTGTQSGNITVTPSNSCGNGTPDTLVVSPGLNPAQTSAITGNTVPCQGSTQTYSVTNVSGITYIWTVPVGWSITSGQGTSSITVTCGTQGGNVTVTPSSSCGNGASTTLAVSASYVTAYAGPDINIPYGSSTTIYGDAGNGSGNYAWSWQPASLFVNATVQNPTTVNLTTNTVFTLTVTDNVSGCTDDDQVTVVVTGGELFVEAYANPEIIYLGDSSQLSAPTGGGSGNYTWTWSSNPAGFSSGLQNPAVNPVESTMYMVTVNDGINTATDSVLLTINYLPAPPAMPAGPDSTDLAYSFQTTFSIPAVAGATLYEWEVYPTYAGTFAKSNVEGTITWASSFMGYAVVKVRAYNSYGYSGWSEEKIIFVDNTTGTGLQESRKLILYPNPASASLHIEIPENLSGGNGMMAVYDARGRKLSEQPVTGDEMIVDVSAFMPGVYVVRFSDDKFVAIGKFVKD